MAVIDAAEQSQRYRTTTIAKLKAHPNLVRAASILVTLAGWEWYGRGVDPIFLSYPTAIASVVPEMIARGDLQNALGTSLLELAVGLSLAIGIGVVIGLPMGRYRLVDYVLDIQLNALYSTPYVALIPLIILWFGLDFSAKIAIIFVSGIFPVVVNTYAGVRNVGNALVDIARVEGASEAKIFTKIVIPASLPFIMAGIRLAMGRSIVGMVVAEMFMTTSGLGGGIVNYGNAFATDKLFVVIIILALLGVTLTDSVKFLERYLAPWKESERTN